jgi:hypothetical protein
MVVDIVTTCFKGLIFVSTFTGDLYYVASDDIKKLTHGSSRRTWEVDVNEMIFRRRMIINLGLC